MVKAQGIRGVCLDRRQDLSQPEGNRSCRKHKVKWYLSLSISWFAVIKAVGHSLFYILQTIFFVVDIWSGKTFFVIMAISYFYWQQ